MDPVAEDEIRQQERQAYAKVAQAANQGDACGTSNSCCGVPSDLQSIDSSRIGYTTTDSESVPEGADLGLGCGNPNALAKIQIGHTVLDLGSGAGFDCFLAAQQTGPHGQVIGVDMTPEMISKARGLAQSEQYRNVDFRLGEIEHLPIPDHSVDVVISNCVINLSPNKQQVFNECFRVLKAGGHLTISDVVAIAPLDEGMKQDLALYSACLSGASPIDELSQWLSNSGFIDIRIQPKQESQSFIKDWSDNTDVTQRVQSAIIEAVKPGSNKGCC